MRLFSGPPLAYKATRKNSDCSWSGDHPDAHSDWICCAIATKCGHTNRLHLVKEREGRG